MRHHALILRGALRANARPLPKRHALAAQLSPILILSGSSQLSRTRLRCCPQQRSYSSSSPEPQPRSQPQPQPPIQPKTETQPQQPEQEQTPSPYPSAANPPPTTRPPPLNLPARPREATSFFSAANIKYLIARGIAYMVFYKTGLSHILTNTRLLFFSSSPSSSSIAAMRPEPHTRAFSLLYRRWQHDARRLPLFALMLLVCGELTPFAVLFLPRVVPFTCRIPSQVEKVLREAEARRRAARRLVAAGGAAAGEDFARSWSGGEGRAGEKKDGKGGAARIKVVGAARATPEALAMILDLPVRSWTRKKRLWSRIHERLHFLNVDDGLLAEAGGAEALVAEELRLACADRGIDVLGRSEEELRTALGRWLHLTDERRLGVEERQKAVLWLLLSEESQWDRFEG